MKYRLTTIEQDAEGNVSRINRSIHSRSNLASVVQQAKTFGLVPGAISGFGLTIIEVEFTSEGETNG